MPAILTKSEKRLEVWNKARYLFRQTDEQRPQHRSQLGRAVKQNMSGKEHISQNRKKSSHKSLMTWNQISGGKKEIQGWVHGNAKY